MQHKDILKLILRDLDRLEDNINQYDEEATLWKTDKDISNSAGNLCLHLCGNLQHFLGHVILKTDYVRDRSYEFGGGPETKEQLFIKIEETRRIVTDLSKHLNEEILQQDYPLNVLGYKMTVGYFLIHLYGHFNYHMGQINYCRRLLG